MKRYKFYMITNFKRGDKILTVHLKIKLRNVGLNVKSHFYNLSFLTRLIMFFSFIM